MAFQICFVIAVYFPQVAALGLPEDEFNGTDLSESLQ